MTDPLDRIATALERIADSLEGAPVMRRRTPAKAAKAVDESRVQQIQRTVADFYGVPRRSMLTKNRRFAFPRQVAMTICTEQLGLSTTQIGRAFGGRDHSTVCHAWKRVENANNGEQANIAAVRELCREGLSA